MTSYAICYDDRNLLRPTISGDAASWVRKSPLSGSARHSELPGCGRPRLARSSTWLESGIRGARFGRMAQGGAVRPARARLSWLTGLAQDLVAPVGIGCGRTLRVAAPDRFCPGCGAGLALFPVRLLAGIRFRPGLIFRLQVLAGGTGIGRRSAGRVAGGRLDAGSCVIRRSFRMGSRCGWRRARGRRR